MTYSRIGTDTSGRALLATPYAKAWLAALAVACRKFHAPFTPTLVQGAFMASLGGGATASAGYHDGAGCYDFRIWDLTDEQQKFLVRECRRRGGAAWIRDAHHGGMDPHCHVVIGGDEPKASGAKTQWGQYLRGLDGLASGGRDYHWRPSPLVTGWQPPKPSPTPNVTKALKATSRAARVAALNAVVRAGSPASKTAAREALASIAELTAAEQHLSKSLTALRATEIK